MSELKPYTLTKGALLDVSDYVHAGVAIEDIEDILDKELTSKRCAICRPVNGFLAYDVRTTLKTDNEVSDLLDKIVDKLDILLVDSKEKSFLKKI